MQYISIVPGESGKNRDAWAEAAECILCGEHEEVNVTLL